MSDDDYGELDNTEIVLVFGALVACTVLFFTSVYLLFF